MRTYVIPALLLFFVSSASADNWSLYRGMKGDGKSSESIAGPNPSMKTLWKTKAPLGFSSFSVADGRAFTITAENGKEVCIAMDANSGDEQWRFEMGSSEYEQGGGNAGAPGNRGGDGPRSTPVVDGSLVYVYDSYLNLHCLDAKSGKLVWEQDVLNDFEGRNIKWLNASSPVILGDSVVVGGGGAGQSFLAFNKRDGQVQWKSGDETITHATPTPAEINGKQQVIFFVQSGLVGVELATGNELWRTEFPFSVSTAASPVVSGNLVYCSAGYGVGAGLFEVQPGGKVEEKWFESNKLMNHWSTPIVHNGHLYGIYEFKKYGKAPLQCVELATGEIKWSERGFGPGNCILVGDKLVVLSDAGEVAIVSADPNGYDELAREKVLSGKCWSTPAFSEGRIFVRSTEEAACLEIAN